MPDQSSLPADAKALADRVAEIEAKKAKAVELGAEPAQIAEFDEYLVAVRGAAVRALAKDALIEAKAAGAAADALGRGGARDGRVEINDEVKRIDKVTNELGNIEEKLKIALANGADPTEIEDIREEIAKLDPLIADAAVAAAKREALALEAEIERIKNGQAPPPPPPPPAPPPPPPPPPGTGSSGFAFGLPASGNSVGETAEDSKPPDAKTIYVRSSRTVWAWRRFDNAWVPQSFVSDIREVDTIGDGLLVVADHGAAVWDTRLGQWLTLLDVPNDTLLDGASG